MQLKMFFNFLNVAWRVVEFLWHINEDWISFYHIYNNLLKIKTSIIVWLLYALAIYIQTLENHIIVTIAYNQAF